MFSFLFPKTVEQLKTARDIKGLVKASRKESLGQGRVTAINALAELGDRQAVAPLIAALGSTGPKGTPMYVREAAAEALGRLGDARALEPLLEALKDPWEDLQVVAAEALTKLNDTRVVEPLIKMLQDESIECSDTVAKTLGLLGDARAVEPLIKALKDGGSLVRECAAEALGSLGDNRAVEPLMDALRDEDRGIRTAAAEALGRLGDSRAVEPLARALQDREQSVFDAAFAALKNLAAPHATAPLTRALGNKEGRVRIAVAEILARQGATQWRDVITGHDRDDFTRIAQSGDAHAADALASAYDATKWTDLGTQIAELLGGLGGSAAWQALARSLEAADRNAAVSLSQGLADKGDPQVAGYLTREAMDGNATVRITAAYALGKLGDTWALEALRKELRNASPSTRVAAADALAGLGESEWKRCITGDPADFPRLDGVSDDHGAAALVAQLEHPAPHVRLNAMLSLGKLGDAHAVVPLLRAMNGASDSELLSIIPVLADLGDPRALEPIFGKLFHYHANVREAAAKALCTLGEPEWKQRVTGYSHDFERLAESKDPRLVELLLDAWEHNPRTDSNRIAIINALGSLGDARAVEPMSKAAESSTDDAIRVAAAEALGNLGDARAVKSLASCLVASPPEVRIAAANSLGKLGVHSDLAEKFLTYMLRRDTLHERVAASLALHKLGRAVDPGLFLLGLGAQDQDIRSATAQLLDGLGETAWKQIITGDLKHDLEGIARSGDPRVPDWMSLYLKSPEWAIRSAAVSALGTLDDVRAADLLVFALGDESMDIRLAAAEALRAKGEPKWAELSTDTLERYFSGLAESEDPRTLTALENAVRSHESEVYEAAIQALGDCGGDGAVALLRKALGQDTLPRRKAAANALIAIAKTRPSLLSACWEDVAKTIREPHRDIHHSEAYSPNDCTSCRRTDSDRGIGMEFPEKPAGLDF